MDRDRTFAVGDWVRLTDAGNQKHLGRVAYTYYDRSVTVRWHPEKGWRMEACTTRYLEHYTPTEQEIVQWIEWELTK